MNISEKIANYLLGRVKSAYISRDIASSNKSEAFITVVSRGFYKEFKRELPFTKRADINKAIKVELDLKPDSSVVMYSKSVSNKSAVVTYYEFDKSAFINKFQKSWFVVPESIAFASLTPKGKAIQFGDLFVSNANGLITTSAKTPVINNLFRFAEANGVTPDKVYEIGEVASLAKLALSKMDLKTVVACYNRKILDLLSNFNYKKYLLVSLAAIFVTNIGIGLWLINKKVTLEDEINAMNSQVTTTLNLSDNKERYGSQLEDYRQLIETKRFTSPIWQVLADTFPLGTRVNYVRLLLDGRYNVSMEAEDATAILKLINSSEIVNSAQLDGDVQRYRGRQRFKVSIYLEGAQ